MSTPADKPLAESIGWQPLSTEYPFQSPWFNLRSDRIRIPTAEEPIRYSYVEHPGSVFVVPMTPDQHVIMIRSYRYPIDAYCWEIPAGQLQPGKTPKQSAAAELREELGATCKSLVPITTLHLANGFASAQSHFFVGIDTTIDQSTELEPGEVIHETAQVSIAKAVDMITQQGQDGDSALAVLLAAHQLGLSTK